MSTAEKIKEYLIENKVDMAVDDFIADTSNIYHNFEAKNYDERHFGIKLSEKYWDKATERILNKFHGKNNLHFLDFGCGTGFAAQQIISKYQLNIKIKTLICYDLSPAMIDVCKDKFNLDKRFKYFEDKAGFQDIQNQQFDIIACNALLHHIMEPETLIKVLTQLLKKDGILIIGHEPNKKFYSNKYLKLISFVYRWNKKILNKLKQGFIKKRAKNSDLSMLTHKRLVENNVIPKDFPINYLPKFVDIHVPMSNLDIQPWGEMGFDAEYIIRCSDHSLDLLDVFTYNHIKDQQAYKNIIWRNLSRILEFIYPKDGADLILILRKK